MKYQVSNFKVSPLNKKDLEEIIRKKYKLNNFKYRIIHKSIDARNKNDIMLNYKLLIETNDILSGKDISIYKDKEIKLEYPSWNSDRPVIVGFGPAGMLAGLYLARCKAKPIIIERGSKIEERKEKVKKFLDEKILDENSNVQFGEGGAGTFSDGKLVTNVNDPLINFILNEFYLHGAKEDILYDAKPHIGTDYLEKIVRNIRLEIEQLGGEIYFDHQFTDYEELADSILLKIKGSTITEVKTKHLILGLGHSAKDTIRMLHKNGLSMEQKAFSMGVRIEHPADMINESQYGKFKDVLPTAYYKLACHNNDRGIYTFCMCPGGYVLASQADKNTIVVNGMSNNDRGNVNSNSALLVDVRPSDYDKGSVLDGIDFQEKYERLAYNVSKDYRAPANLVSEFLNDKVAKEQRSVKTSYVHGLAFTDLNNCLPDFVVSNLKYGIKNFATKIKGFDNPDAILIGIESRSSSPVRIIRDENRTSSLKYIYPVGEGAGYAGGITSAALDGLKTAIHIAEKCQ